MSRPAVKAIIVACVVLLHASVGLKNVHAYTLMDWMRSWPNYYGASPPAAPVALPATPPVSPTPVPVITTPPNVTLPPGAATPPPTIAAPPTTCAGPATTSSASPVYAPAASTTTFGSWCERLFCRRAVGYRPEVRYRTRLMRVPTTNYRPVITYHPVTGAPTTSMQPCTTYSWQFRRLPYTTYRPIYSPVTTPWSPPASPAVTGYYPGTVMPGASTTCAPPAATPYYTPPTAPATPALPPTPKPSLPANQPLNLSPSGLPPSGNGQPGATTTNFPPLESSGESSGRSSDGASHEVKKEPTPPAGGILDLTPVPDPDAGTDRKQVPAAPSLFDPNDRTANRSARPAWAYSTIAWPEKPKGVIPQRTPAEVTKPLAVEEKEEFDSGGWRSVRQ